MIPVSTVGSVIDSSFNPKYVSNLQLWFDAADAATMYDSSTGGSLTQPSGTIGRWEDKGPNLWHATQSVAANQPRRITGSAYNGLDTIRFDGVDDILRITTVGASAILKQKTGATFFMVASVEIKTTATSDIIQISTATSGRLRFSQRADATTGLITPIYRRLDGDAAFFPVYRGVTSSGSLLNCYTIGAKYDASSSYYYVNGSQQILSGSFPSSWSGSTSNIDSANISIGSSGASPNFLLGNIAEIIIYDKYLNDIERRSIERYLLRKWNVRSYDQKTTSSTDIFSNVDVFLDANNAASNPGSGTTWTDLSGNGRNGTLANGASFATSQSVNYVSCDGTNDFVNLGQILNYTSENFTLSGWFWFPTTDYGVENIIPWWKGDPGGYYSAFQDTNIGLVLIVTSQSGGTAQISFTSAFCILPNNWNFVTMTRSGANISIYLNGVYATTSRGVHVNPTSVAGNNFQLGAYSTYIYSNIRIGLFIAHSKALASQEVLELYHFTKRSYNKID